MIYQLVKRQLPWKFAIAFSVIFTAASFVSFRVGVTVFSLGVALLVIPKFGRRRCTVYEATLPIRGRDLLCSRLVKDILAVWLVYLPMVGVVFAAHRHRQAVALIFLEVAAILAVAMVAMESVDVRALNAPRWWQRSVWALVAIAVFAICIPSMQAEFPSAPPALAICVFAACALIGFGLLRRILASTPESFEIAPRAEGLRNARAKRSWLPSFAWMPLLRMMWSPILYFLLLCALMVSLGSDLYYNAICLVLAPWMLVQVLREASWLFILPLSRHRIFLLMMFVPAFAGIAVGEAIVPALRMAPAPFSRLGVATPGTMFFDSAITLATFFLGIVAMQGLNNQLRHPLRSRLTMLVFTLLMASQLAWLILGHNRLRFSLSKELVERFPSHIALLMSMALAVVAILYWQAYRVFSRLEVLTLPINRYAKKTS